MAKREQFANDAITTLNGAINNVTTTVTVVDGSIFPADGNFRILVESELMLVTARVTNVLTVERGIEGTSGASHGNGSDVEHVLTKGGMTRFVKDNARLVDATEVPLLGSITNASGTILTTSDFTWVNQGGAAASDLTNGDLLLTAPPNAGTSLRTRTIVAGDAPKTLTVGFSAHLHGQGSCNCGIGFRENATGEMIIIAALYNGMIIRKMDSATVVNTNVRPTQGHLINAPMWFRAVDDNVDIKLLFSSTGVDFIEVFSEARLTFLSAVDEFVFFVDTGSSTAGNNAHMLIHHWGVE